MANNNLITVDSLTTILQAFKESMNTNNATQIDNFDVPVINITGTLPTSKTYVSGKIEYTSKIDNFVVSANIKLQGNSSLSNPKKNYTIKLNQKKAFKNWEPHDTFTLKADYIDILKVRNIACAKLWGKIVSSRDSYPEELKTAPNFGAVDGFPVKVYLNGEYNGIYNFTTHKDAKMFGMSTNNTNHTVLQNEINDNGDDSSVQENAGNFQTEWSGIDGDCFSIQVGEASSTLTNSFNQIYYAISNETDLNNYLDINSLIDYYIFQDVILGTDGLAKNMLLATYDMTKWYLSAYDLDSTLDLSWEGELLNSPSVSLFDSNGNTQISAPYLNFYSQLPVVIGSNYWEEYKARYAELRNSVLSYSSIMAEIENYFRIYNDLYIEETIKFPNTPLITENTISHIREFVKQHLNYLDSLYLN